jgi:predicted acylesterase/phospholipase RssA
MMHPPAPSEPLRGPCERACPPARAGAEAGSGPPDPPPPREPRTRKTLVLSGGGAKAIWQVGACEHLVAERGYWFDNIASISAGAVNGTTLAQAHNAEELKAELEHLRSVWFGLRGNHDVYESRRLIGFLLGRQAGVYDVAPLRRVLLEHIDPPRVAASPVGLRIGYVDLLSGRYCTAGNDHPALVDAVLASCALPLVFPAVPLRDGQELGVDGGIRQIIPLLDVLGVLAERPLADGRDEIWILDPNPPYQVPQARSRHWLTLVRRCLSLLTDFTSAEGIAQTRQVIDLLRSSANPSSRRDMTIRVLQPRQELGGSVLDFDPAKLRRWYADGMRTARAGGELQV